MDRPPFSQQNTALAWRVLEPALDREVPRWRAIITDPQWVAWLHGLDSLTALPRQRLLDDAVAKNDAGRVVALFRGFQATQHGQRQASQQASSAMPAGRHVYSRQDIVTYSDAYWRGQISETDYQRLSSDIHAAVKEGRIVDPPMRGIGKVPY
jgi:hypothetical protein